MKHSYALLFLLLPVIGWGQTTNFPVTISGSGSSYSEIICTRTHIDTIKNVMWYIEIRHDIDSIMPMSVGCPNHSCTFLHTWNDQTKEDHWYEMYHGDKDELAYYIHEVYAIAIKKKGAPIIYPKH